MEKGQDKMLSLSVITVCYNAEESIEKTMQSVLNQSYENIEYLIIDGQSTDSTLEIVKKYQEKYKNIRLVSEKDSGIYNAMNKGASYAQGEYIYYLNSGDLFPNETIVEQVMQKIEKTKPDILYGNIDVDYGTHQHRILYAKQKRLKKLWIALGITVCHQAVFAKTSLLKERGFDESFKLWADQEWMMQLLKKKVTVETIEESVCIYDGFGESSSAVNLELVFQESDRITKKYTPVIYYVTKPMKWVLRIYRRWQRRNG